MPEDSLSASNLQDKDARTSISLYPGTRVTLCSEKLSFPLQNRATVSER